MAKKLIKGVNDLQTTYPGLAKEWDYEKNYPLTPSDISYGCGKFFYWICPNGHESYLQSPNKRTSQNAGCQLCWKGRQTSFAEQAVFYYIKKRFPDAVNRFKDIFDNGMELDIFVPSIALAIEYDGVAFHKNNKIEREERKYQICKQHNIKLIRIKEQKLDEIWDSGYDIADKIYQTEYDGKDILKLEDTIRCLIQGLILSTPKIDIKKDELSIRELSAAFFKGKSLADKHPELVKEWHPTKNGKLTPYNVSCGSDYNAWWLCSKCGHEWQTAVNKRTHEKTGCKNCYLERIKTECPNNIAILQYSLDGQFIKEWRSISYASRELGINAPNISMCAKGKRPNAGGYKWRYKN